jgi:hypothetical protein
LDELTFNLSNRPSIAYIIPSNGQTTNSNVITLTFTEKVIGFDASDLEIFNGSLAISSFQNIDDDDIAFSFTINVTNQGPFGFTIAESALKDEHGDTNPQLSYSFVYDTVKPEIAISSDTVSTTHSQTIPITVVFSEPVIGFTVDDLTLSNASIEDNSFSGDNTVYQLKINPLNKGSILVTIDSGVVADLAGNTNIPGELRLYYEPEPQDVTLTVNTVAGPYLPEHNYIVSVSMNFTKGMTSLGYTIEMPDNWAYQGFSSNPQGVEKHSGKFEFYVTDCIDKSSVAFDFAVNVPASESESSRQFLAKVTYRYADGPQKILDSSFDATLQTLVAEHYTDRIFYAPNVQIPINVKIQLTEETGIKNDFSSLGLYVFLPEDWKYKKTEIDGTQSYGRGDPELDATGLLHFYWLDVDDHLSNNPINLTYFVSPPAGAVSAALLTSTVEYRFSNSITKLKPLEDLTFNRADPNDTTPPEVINIEYYPKEISMIAPVTLQITLSEKVLFFDRDNIKIEPSGYVESIIPSETNDQSYQVIILPEICGSIEVFVTNLMDESGIIQKNKKSVQLLIDCTTYNGQVYDDIGLLPDVTVKVVFPEDHIYPETSSNENGVYTLHLPKLFDKKYAFRLEKQDYISDTFTSDSSPDEITFVHQLPPMKLKPIHTTSYQYTIICSVTAESQQPTSTVKVISANSNPYNATAVVTYDKINNLYYLYYVNKPSSVIVSASMGDYNAMKSLSSSHLVGNSYHVDLDMELPVPPEPEERYIETSKPISKESGGTIKLISSNSQSLVEVEIPPNVISFDAVVNIETHDKKNSSFAAHSELVEINTEAAIIGELNVKIKTFVNIVDIISGKNAVFWANNPQAFIAGNVQEIPLDDILTVDQEPGFIRFKMRHLTSVAVGNSGLIDKNAGQRRCFISTLQSLSFNPLIAIFVLTIILSLFRNKFSRR